MKLTLRETIFICWWLQYFGRLHNIPKGYWLPPEEAFECFSLGTTIVGFLFFNEFYLVIFIY